MKINFPDMPNRIDLSYIHWLVIGGVLMVTIPWLKNSGLSQYKRRS